MKKVLKIFAIVIGILVVLFIAFFIYLKIWLTPEKAGEIISNQILKYTKLNIKIQKISIGFNFKGFHIKGENIKVDTFGNVKQTYFGMAIIPLLKKKVIVKKIEINSPDLIFKIPPPKKETLFAPKVKKTSSFKKQKKDTLIFPFVLQISKFEVKDGKFKFIQTKDTFSIKDLNFSLTSKVEKNFQKAKVQSKGKFKLERFPLNLNFSNKNLGWNFKINYILKDSVLNVPFAQIFFDNLKLNFELYAKKVLSKNPKLKIYIPKQSFDIVSLYSLFSGFQRRAKVKIKSGRYIIKNLTIFLNLPDSFKGMWGDMMVENLTLLKDTFYVNIPQLSLNFSGKDIKLFLKLLSKGIESLSNLKLSLSFKKLNLAKIDLIGDMKTKINLSVFSPDIKYGKSDINLNFSGFVFPNEKKFDLNGNLIFVLKNFLLKSLKRQIDKIEASAGFKISSNEQNFYLTNFSFKAGKSYLTAKGSGYNKASLESKTPNIRGDFSVYSTLIDLNELLKETKQTQKKASPKKETLALKIPKFIKLNLKARLNKIIFKKETISNLVFNIKVLNGNIYIDNLSMNAYGGKVFGKISMLTSSPTKVYVDLKGKNLKFSKIMHHLKFIGGKIRGNADFGVRSDFYLGRPLETLKAKIKLSAKNGYIKKDPLLEKIADKIKYDFLRKFRFKKIGGELNIANQWVYLKNIKLTSKNFKMFLDGKVSFKKKLDLKIDLTTFLPKKVRFKIKVKGDYDNPRIYITSSTLKKEFEKRVKKKIEEKKKEFEKRIEKEFEKKKKEWEKKIKEKLKKKFGFP